MSAGSAVDGDTLGDCKKSQCDGAGKVVSVNDDTDLPDDKNPCTDDVCTNGVPSHPFKTVGTTCGTSLVCDGAGNCQGCNQPSDCSGTDDDCSSRTCKAGVCGRAFTKNGTAVTAQTAGDCKKAVCDGAGNVTSVNDDSDIASDGNSCTNDVCTNGVLSHPTVADGTSCENGKLCKAGVCTGCTTANDCPGTDTECRTRTCTDGVCGAVNGAQDKVLTAQTDGDCKTAICDGNGRIVSRNDDTDLPVDGLQCTNDVCTNGVPSHPPVPVGTTCTDNGGSFCNGNGACVSPSCTDGIRNGDETDVDCGGTTCPACGQVTVTPADAATNVAVNATITLTFTSAMDSTTITAQSAAGACAGSVQVSADDFATCLAFNAPGINGTNKVVTLTPTANFANNTTYKVRVTNAAKTSGGVAAAPYTMTTGFTTATGVTCAAHGFNGALVTFDLTGAAGDQASSSAKTTAAGVTSSVLTRSSAVKATQAADSISSTNWGTTNTVDASRYYTFTVTPATGCSLQLSSLALDVKASGTGPTKGDVATSVDNFGAHSSPSFSGTSKPTVSLSATKAGAIEVRIYGYGASASSGTFRIQNTMTLSGTIQ
ncbi:Putative secreted sialidase [Labilithrix luteola]|uniref:Putative secreted sialidase n=1 Tax=Labilithrix luteola TaxID=1391654 RepID=A0A0K1PJQ3_9BACT|nr:Ig-like domain-containing protein [Labilithrix luteola]AKU93768.1 Putative secreted sialidase [Labilithrix luteola]